MKSLLSLLLVGVLLPNFLFAQIEPGTTRDSYFNGPVKRVEQRVFDRNEDDFFYDGKENDVPFSFRLTWFTLFHPDRQSVPQSLIPMAWEFDSTGFLTRKTTYRKNPSYPIQSDFKYAIHPIIGRHIRYSSQLIRGIYPETDSLVLSYDSARQTLQTLTWRQTRKGDWYQLKDQLSDSVIRFRNLTTVYLHTDTVVHDSVRLLENGLTERILHFEGRRNKKRSISIDTIQFTPDYTVRYFSHHSYTSSWVKYWFDSLGRKVQYLSQSHSRDSMQKDMRWDYSEENGGVRYRKTVWPSVAGERWPNYVDTYTEVDSLGRILRITEYLTLDEGLEPKLTFESRYSFDPDSQAFREAYYSKGRSLDGYEETRFDPYGNAVRFVKGSGFLEGHRRQTFTAEIAVETYDEYGNWTRAIYKRNGNPICRMERSFMYWE